jgi:hypothetical protein
VLADDAIGMGNTRGTALMALALQQYMSFVFVMLWGDDSFIQTAK